MELKSERISLALLLVVVIPATVALPFPKTHPTSNFRETIEIVAGLLAKEAEKDFGSAPNSLGEGRAVGLLNIQGNTEGIHVYWGGEKIIPIGKEYIK